MYISIYLGIAINRYIDRVRKYDLSIYRLIEGRHQAIDTYRSIDLDFDLSMYRHRYIWISLS